jgi:hypothetical protein
MTCKDTFYDTKTTCFTFKGGMSFTRGDMG